MENTFTSEQQEVLLGILLGDAHLETRNNGKTFRLKVEQSLQHEAYVNHLYTLFKDDVLTLPKRRNIQSLNKRSSTNVRFATISSGKFKFLGEQFYPDTKKKVVPELINHWLTPRALAYWFMDDGSMKSKYNKAVILNTQGFYFEEVVKLCSVLEENFKVSCWPRKQKNETYQIYISGKSYEILRELIYDFILPEMRYKFPLPRKKSKAFFL